MFEQADLVYAYTRARAIADGVLVDVSKMAEQAGFLVPVAVTRSVWDELIVPDEPSRRLGQSEEGRLWDILNVARWAMWTKGKSPRVNEVRFHVTCVVRGTRRRTATLKAVLGPGDQGEPVITVMFPDED